VSLLNSVCSNLLNSNKEGYLQRFRSRSETIDTLDRTRKCDVLVVGGGIHGAFFAHLARFNGLGTALFEKFDYASQTSGRSSKMAHGGLRYLEMYDFQQVLEGIRAREDLFETAGHIVKPHDFLIPIAKGDWFFKLQLKLGLTFYDLMLRNKTRRHGWVPLSNLEGTGLGEASLDTCGAFRYTDGIMDDTRLVLENIIAARQEGAHCLNYAEVMNFRMRDKGGVEVTWRDNLSGERHQILAGVVVNCAGPWVPEIGRINSGPLARRLKFSQGTHLLFNKKWEGPALFLPLDEKTRYYFVWPHYAGTMVGTTEREVPKAEFDPLPLQDEVEEILARLQKDLPTGGLDRSSLHYSFAGTRTLPLRGRGKNVSRISRKHIWHYSAGILSLLGGKYTTASWTAFEGLKKVFKIAGIQNKCESLKGRKLPGFGLYSDSIKEFERIALEKDVPQRVIERTISRLGSRVRYLNEKEENFELFSNTLLRGEVEMAFDLEQVENLDDLMCRRLGFEYCDGYGFELLPEFLKIAADKRGNLNLEEEERKYREKIQKVRGILGLE